MQFLRFHEILNFMAVFLELASRKFHCTTHVLYFDLALHPCYTQATIVTKKKQFPFPSYNNHNHSYVVSLSDFNYFLIYNLEQTTHPTPHQLP